MLWRLLLNSGSGAERGRITEVRITEDSRDYIVPFTYGKFSSRNTRITVCCHIMGDIFAWNRCTVLEWGTVREFSSSTMTLLDDQLVRQHPDIIAR